MDWGWKGFFKRLFEFPDADGDDAPAPAGRARWRYDHGAGQLQVSRNQGAYLPIAAGGAGVVSVDTVAELSALSDAAMLNGTTVEVNSVLDQFSLDKTSTAVADGITIAVTASGTGRWIRRNLGSIEWDTQATWHVDSVAGNDENTGIDAANAIKTWDELRRRLNQVQQVTTVQLHGAGPYPELVCDWETVTSPGAVVDAAMIISGEVIAGDQLVLAAFGTTPHNNALGTRVYGTCGFSVDVSAYLGDYITVVNGAAAGAASWAFANTSAGTTVIYTGPFLDGTNTEVFPAAGDTVQFNTLTQVAAILVRHDCLTSWSGVEVTGEAAFEGGAELTSAPRCKFDSDVYAMGYHPNYGAAGGDQGWSLGAQFAGTYFADTLVADHGALVFVETCQFYVGRTGGGLFVKPAGMIGISGTFGFIGDNAGGEPTCQIQGLLRMASGSIAFENYSAATTCMTVYDKGFARCRGDLWGRDIASGGAGVCINARAGSILTYLAANPPDFTARTAMTVGGTAKTIATLPYPEPTNLAAIVVDA